MDTNIQGLETTIRTLKMQCARYAREIGKDAKEIERLRKALDKIVEREKYISDDEYLPLTAGEIAKQALKEE